MQDDKYTPPEKTARDRAYKAVDRAISLIPDWRASAAGFLVDFLSQPIDRRLQEWRQNVAQGIRDLERNLNIQLYKLQDNPRFISAILQTTQIAVRNHKKEQLEALRNAALNCALPDAPEDDTQAMFIRFLDDLTPTHLSILRFTEDPPTWCRLRGISVDARMMAYRADMNASRGNSQHEHWVFLERILPGARKNQEFYCQVFSDLMDRGLLKKCIGFDLACIDLRSPLAEITPFGKSFLRFVSSPSTNDSN